MSALTADIESHPVTRQPPSAILPRLLHLEVTTVADRALQADLAGLVLHSHAKNLSEHSSCSPAAAPITVKRMSGWWIEVFGDPCRSCAYHWSVSLDAATARVSDCPKRLGALLHGHDGRERHPELSWTAKAYVAHVADNLRIWAERMAAASAGVTAQIGEYDDNLLAQARAYEQMPLEGALWSLGKAVDCWEESVAAADAKMVVLNHPVRGKLSVLDVVRSNCHDVVHHEWDIGRSLASSKPV